MDTEQVYRFALVLVILLNFSVIVYFRWQAMSDERISRQPEGYAFAVTLRLAGLLAWLAVLTYLLVPSTIAWASIPIPELLRWIGVGSGLACAGMMYWTLSHLGKNLTDTVVVRSNASLIRTGPYRIVRHPFYVAAACLMISAVLISANALIAVSSILVLLLLVIRTPKEEQKLMERFGDDYRAYMQTTGRFLPRSWTTRGR